MYGLEIILEPLKIQSNEQWNLAKNGEHNCLQLFGASFARPSFPE